MRSWKSGKKWKRKGLSSMSLSNWANEFQIASKFQSWIFVSEPLPCSRYSKSMAPTLVNLNWSPQNSQYIFSKHPCHKRLNDEKFLNLSYLAYGWREGGDLRRLMSPLSIIENCTKTPLRLLLFHWKNISILIHST